MSWKWLKGACAIGLTALIVSACSTSRKATSSSSELRVEGIKSVQKVDSVMVAVRDTIVETTTITVRENEAGDTLRLSKVTERDRIRDRAQVKNKEVEVRVVKDTVFVEKRDSVSATKNLTDPTSRASPVKSVLKWIFWIIIGVIALVIVLRVNR